MKSRAKGDRIERKVMDLLRQIGVHSERVPLSGSPHYRGADHDLDVYLLGRDDGPLVTEVKARAHGEGFRRLEDWLGDHDMLVLHRDRAGPMVTLPWATVVRIAERIKELEACERRLADFSGPRLVATSGRPEHGGDDDGKTGKTGAGAGVPEGGPRAA